MGSSVNLTKLILAPFGMLALLFGILLASPVQAQQSVSLDVGLEDASGFFFAAVSNDGPDFIQLRGLEAHALDVNGQILCQTSSPQVMVLGPGEASFLYLQPSVPCNPDDVAAFEGFAYDPSGAVVATDGYNNDVGIRNISYDSRTQRTSLKFKNVTQSDITVKRVVITWYHGHEQPWSEEYDNVNVNVPAGGDPVNWTSPAARASKSPGDSKIIQAYDPDGQLVGKGSYTVPSR